MNGSYCSFTPTEPRIWHGKYARIPGEGTAFHVRFLDHGWRPCVMWVIRDETALCPMVTSKAAIDLGHAVNAGKKLLGSPAGGAFLINEFQQVLVPSSCCDRQIAVVGEWEGSLEFRDAFHGGTFDLTTDAPLVSGASWELPYLGIPYHLSSRSEIYFWNQDVRSGAKTLPLLQDNELIAALRILRPSGAVRFVVSSGGLVLTKVPVGRWPSQRWEARYVGRLNYKRWYSKEEQ
jgi:hypothetical protein